MSDWRKKTIVLLDASNGHLLKTIDVKGKKPYGLTVDGDLNVYTCNVTPKEICVWSPNFEQCRIVLSGKDLHSPHYIWLIMIFSMSSMSVAIVMTELIASVFRSKAINWTASSEFGTYRLCEQRRFRRACASAQSRQNLRCSLIQAVSQEKPSDRKPDPWPLWMPGHAQLKFV